MNSSVIQLGYFNYLISIIQLGYFNYLVSDDDDILYKTLKTLYGVL